MESQGYRPYFSTEFRDVKMAAPLTGSARDQFKLVCWREARECDAAIVLLGISDALLLCGT